eukprot:1161796-Pelagomonas_calceolata.AAC.9
MTSPASRMNQLDMRGGQAFHTLAQEWLALMGAMIGSPLVTQQYTLLQMFGYVQVGTKLTCFPAVYINVVMGRPWNFKLCKGQTTCLIWATYSPFKMTVVLKDAGCMCLCWGNSAKQRHPLHLIHRKACILPRSNLSMQEQEWMPATIMKVGSMWHSVRLLGVTGASLLELDKTRETRHETS